MVSTNAVVYVVDDDASVREGLSSLLRANGKDVRIFNSGQEFLGYDRQDSCACLILDLRMPGMNGFEVQKLIAAETTIPVIFITGRGDVTAMKGGAIDFLTKPIDDAVLLDCIERALEQNQSTRSVSISHPTRATSVTPVGQRPVEQAGCRRTGYHGIYGSNTPRPHYAEDGS
jgi:FixJ family two-component response regulator